MWPADLYVVAGGSGSELLDILTSGAAIESYRALDPLGRAGAQFGGTLLVALVVLGMGQRYGSHTVAKSRRSPAISICIGLPSVLIIGGLASTGYLLIGRSIGTFFGVPLVMLGLTVLPALTAIGFVAVGRSIAARFGRDQLGTGILVGSAIGGLAGFAVPVTAVVVVLVASLGVGAGVRVLFGVGGTTTPDERTIPPANKI